MKILKIAVSMIVILCFSVSNITFASEINAFKLAPQSNFNRMVETEFKEAAQIRIGIMEALKGIDSLTLDNLRTLGERQFSEKTVFASRIAAIISFDRAEEGLLPNEHIVTENGCYIFKASIKGRDGRKDTPYYCLLSKNKVAGQYPVSVVSQRQMEEALQKGIVKFTHESIDSKDKTIIDLYTSHEITTTNNEAIDPWIAERMERGEYAVDNVQPANAMLYKNALTSSYLRNHYGYLVGVVIGKLKTLGVKADNCEKIKTELLSKPFVTIPYDNEDEFPSITINDQRIKVYAHSSQFATYIFVKRNIFDNARSILNWNEDPAIITRSTIDEVIHEVGAICGLSVTAKNGKAWNELDEGIANLEKHAAFTPSDELKNMLPVDLLNLELRNDYAAGREVPESAKKGIFKRVVALVLAGAIGTGVYLFLNSKEHKESEGVSWDRVVVLLEHKETGKIIELLKNKKENVTTRIAAVSAIGSLRDKSALPVLTEALLKDKSPDVRLEVVRVLREIGGKSVLDGLRIALKDDNWHVRKEAREEIGILNRLQNNAESVEVPVSRSADEEKIERINEVIKFLIFTPSDSPDLRQSVKEWLANMGKSAIRPLIEATCSRYESISSGAEGMLVTIGKPAVQPLIEELQKGTRLSRRHAASALGWIGDGEAVLPLIAALADDSTKVRFEAVWSLGIIGDKRATRPLVDLLHDITEDSDNNMITSKEYRMIHDNIIGALVEIGDAEALPYIARELKAMETGKRKDAAKALGKTADIRAVPYLVEALLKDDDAETRENAAWALGQIGSETAISSLEAAMSDKIEAVRLAAECAIVLIEKPGTEQPHIKLLVTRLQSGDESQRVYAAQIFAMCKVDGSISYLIEALNDVSASVRGKAACALGIIGDRQAKTPLCKILKDGKDSINVQESAIAALKYFNNDDEVISALIEAAKKNKGLRKYVIGALPKGNEKIIPLLFEALSDSMPEVRKVAIESLSVFHKKDVRNAIFACLEDANSDVTAPAIEYLGNIGDREAVPALIKILERGEWPTASKAAIALGKIGDQRALAPLRKTYKDGGTAGCAEFAIEEIELGINQKRSGNKANTTISHPQGSREDTNTATPPDASQVETQSGEKISKLIIKLKSEKELARKEAVNELVKVGKPAVPYLIEILNNKNEDRFVRAHAASILGRIGDEKAFQALLEAQKTLRDDKEVVSRSIITVLGNMGDERAIPDLIKRHETPEDRDEFKRWTVEDALLEIGRKNGAKPFLNFLYNDGARKVLIKIGDKKIVDALIEKLKRIEKPEIDKTADMAIRIRCNAAEVLGELGDKKALPALTEASKDENVRKAALWAIEKIVAYNVDELIKQMQSNDPKISEHAVAGLYYSISDSTNYKRKALKAVPTLIGLLRARNADEEYWLYVYTIEALEKIGDQRAIEPLEKALEGWYENIPTKAAKALDALKWKPRSEKQKLVYAIATGDIDTLAKYTDEKTFSVLIERLKYWHTNTNTRKAIAIALGKIGNKKAIAPLIEVLIYPGDENDHSATIESLKQLGWNPDLVKALKHENYGVRRYAARSLGERGDKVAVEPLIEALNDKEDNVVNEVMDALAKLKDKRAVKPIIDKLSALHEGGITYAIDALKEIGDPSGISALVEILKSNDSFNRSRVTEALDAFGWKPQTDEEKICYFIGKEEWKKVAEFGRTAVPYLLRGNENWSTRAAMIRTLGDIGDKTAVKELIDSLGYEDGPAKYALVYTIIKLGDEKIVPDVIGRLGRHDNVQVAMVLGGLKDSRAVEPLIHLLKSEDWWDREAAANALGEIGDTRALQPLFDVIKNDKDVSNTAKEAIEKIEKAQKKKDEILSLISKIKDADIDAIKRAGEIGDKRAVKSLIAMLNNRDDNVRIVATEALGNIADAEAIPALRKMLDRSVSSWPVEEAVIEALAKIGGKESAEALLENRFLRPIYTGGRSTIEMRPGVTMHALIKIGRPAVEPLLKVLTANDHTYGSLEMENIILTLGSIGDERALEPLRKKASSDHMEETVVRRAAQEAIEKIQKANAEKEKKKPAEEKSSKTGALEERDLVREVSDAAFDRLWNGQSINTGNEAVDTRINGAAASILVTLGVFAFPKPKDMDIRAIATRITDLDIEVFMPKSQFPNDTLRRFKEGLGRIFGDRLRVYDNLADLATMIKNPGKSVVMTVDLNSEQLTSVRDSFNNLKDARFMNFERINVEEFISQGLYDNYMMDTLSKLLVARAITKEEASDETSPYYRMLAHLLSGHLPKEEIGGYIRQIANNEMDPVVKLLNLVKLILRALPIEAYKTDGMKPAVEVLWSA